MAVAAVARLAGLALADVAALEGLVNALGVAGDLAGKALVAGAALLPSREKPVAVVARDMEKDACADGGCFGSGVGGAGCTCGEADNGQC